MLNKSNKKTLINSNLNLINLIKLIILIILFIIIIIIFIKFIKLIYLKEKKESFDCTLHINDIDPRHVDNYMKFNNTRIRCGICNKSRLNVKIESTCPTNPITGSALDSCKKQVNITSSYGIPIVFNDELSPDSVNQFFCPSEQF